MFGKGKNVIGKLAAKSQKTLDIFNKTITELTTQNADIDNEINVRDEQMKQLKTEQETLVNLKETNAKVIGKINKIFE
jgi:hypothetical protein